MEQMEEEKKKRMEQKILQSDEKVRSMTKPGAIHNNEIITVSCETKRVQTGHWHDVCSTGLLLMVTNQVVGKSASKIDF